MALSLPLLMLFIITSGFAVPSTAAALLNASDVYVAVANQNYVCDTDLGTYVSSTFYAQLYDASSVDSADNLTADIYKIVQYETDHPSQTTDFSNLGYYITEGLGFKFAGQANDVGGATVEIQISDENTLKVSVVPASQSFQGVTLTNEEGTVTVIVTNINPIAAVPCTSGSLGDPELTLTAIELVYIYGDKSGALVGGSV